jgi:aldehyde dehydrogenase (NAD+)
VDKISFTGSTEVGRGIAGRAGELGAVINGTQFGSIREYLEDGLADPALHVETGGLPPTEGPLAEGFFHVPTLFSSGDNSFRLAREEIFGPVVVAIAWTDVDDVVRMANDTAYGLGAYV